MKTVQCEFLLMLIYTDTFVGKPFFYYNSDYTTPTPTPTPSLVKTSFM